MATGDARERLRLLGQADLGAWSEAATGGELWSIQRKIATAVSKRRARVAVPSAVASGKSHLAARLALAFYDAYTPGVPCAECKGPCGGSKVITTASKFDHLRFVLWGEIRTAYAALVERGVTLPGKMGVGQTLLLDDGSDHFIIGNSASSAEAFQGVHAAHILIIGDEATSIDEATQQGITGVLSTGDARLLLIFNPTTPDTYAALECSSPLTEVIRISAFDTPMFTGEDVPKGAYLISPEFVEELNAKGMGPGTYEYTTRIEANFWSLGEDSLITTISYDKALEGMLYGGTRVLGIDLAPYGNAENAIAYRNGNCLERLDVYPAMRMDDLWHGPITDAVKRFDPQYLIYDADGVGAGCIGYAEDAARHMSCGQLIPFRGAIKTGERFLNARSAWWWHLRRGLESGRIVIDIRDDKLRKQVTNIRYRITLNGEIRVETKEEMRKRGHESPDRGDAFLYAFSMIDNLPAAVSPAERFSPTQFMGLPDRTAATMMQRDMKRVRDRASERLHDADGMPDF